MNHYVNGVSNVSMSNGVITFDFVSATLNDKGENVVKDEVQITMAGATFNGFMNICSEFIEKVKEQSKVKIENGEETTEEVTSNEKKTGKRAKKNGK